MKAVILYDSRTATGSTEAVIDAIGLSLAEAGVYVEKAKCRAMADYSFVKDFDLVKRTAFTFDVDGRCGPMQRSVNPS